MTFDLSVRIFVQLIRQVCIQLGHYLKTLHDSLSSNYLFR